MKRRMGMERISCEFDVVVVGGGTAGAVAAIQAARMGARAAVVELTGQLGGTITTGGVSNPGIFSAWGRQVIAGIGWELVKATLELDLKPVPDFTEPAARKGGKHIRLSAPVFACVAERAAIEAGVVLLYHEMPVEIERSDGGWTVHTVGKGVRREITCCELVDCTGDADIVAMAGFERVKSDRLQPGTLIVRLGGYDPETLDKAEVQRRYEKAIESGALRRGDYAYADRGSFLGFLRARGSNQLHVLDIDGSTCLGKAEANVRGREVVMRLLAFIRTIPGCEGAVIEEMKGETAVRETYRIVGEKTVTVNDYMSGRVWEDAVSHAFYPIDIHETSGCYHRSLDEGVVPTVPFGALVPKGSTRLLAAGRCVSSDREANSALRVEAPCMAMGQAVGAAAALGVKKGVPSREVPLEELRAALREQGAIVP